MDKNILDILDSLTEGIVILDDNLEVIFLNNNLENMLGLKFEEVKSKKIFEVFPKLDKDYFKNTLSATIEKGYKYFFSSKVHKNIISEELNINFKINRIESHGKRYLLMEFVDITNEFIRVKQLKNYVNELSVLNKELQTKESEIEKLLYYDYLTNVGNRMFFYSYAEKLLAISKRSRDIIGLMFIDIDDFKDINDTYGHNIGDKALVEVANILESSIRDTDMVFRFGGDEFLILLSDLHDYDNYKIIAQRIKNANKKVKVDEDIEIDVSLSIGVSFYPRDGDTIDKLILKADEAMYSVKQMGGDQSAYYNCKNEENIF